ncbi:MAG: acyl-CoA dehydrogenase domain protein [Marmoricola sp.]|jgi:alkylation response protein AidB-like acyl-CoA dehydrogenase|nr:acyl-CoA dehydrogenase domain protein [Marmoricola sp.]
MTTLSASTPELQLVELTDDLQSMAETVAAVVRSQSPAERVAAVADGPEEYDEPLWRTLAVDLGVTGVLVPEEYGGLGMGWAEARVVLAELGRGLACVPFLSSCVVAVSVVLESNDAAAAAAILPGVAEGSSIVAVALGDDRLLPALGSSAVAARTGADGGWQLSGVQPFVVDGIAADRILLLGRTDNGAHGWFLVEAGAGGLTRTTMEVVDPTRPQATLTLDGVTARLIGDLGTCDDLVAPALDALVVGTGCEMAEASRHLLDLTIVYATTRYQFGQPIGSFQALQHRLADLAIMIDTSVSAVEYAIASAVHHPERLREAASIAGFVCTEAFYQAALETIQVHGGIGFTWEHQAHRYYRRALASRALLGTPAVHRERLMQSLSL